MSGSKEMAIFRIYKKQRTKRVDISKNEAGTSHDNETKRLLILAQPTNSE